MLEYIFTKCPTFTKTFFFQLPYGNQVKSLLVLSSDGYGITHLKLCTKSDYEFVLKHICACVKLKLYLTIYAHEWIILC